MPIPLPQRAAYQTEQTRRRIAPPPPPSPNRQPPARPQASPFAKGKRQGPGMRYALTSATKAWHEGERECDDIEGDCFNAQALVLWFKTKIGFWLVFHLI